MPTTVAPGAGTLLREIVRWHCIWAHGVSTIEQRRIRSLAPLPGLTQLPLPPPPRLVRWVHVIVRSSWPRTMARSSTAHGSTARQMKMEALRHQQTLTQEYIYEAWDSSDGCSLLA